MAPAHDPAANVLYSASGRCVRDVLVEGVVLKRGHALVGVEEGALVGEMHQRGW
jgi:cytosine/adenosine deaminase-related metal-dependent hydrolase